MRIICVDDEPLAVEYTVGQCRLLSQVSEVKGFTSAQEALDDLMIHPADVAILDINMPQIDGITLAARIKEAHPQTAILFLTAYKEYAFDAYSDIPQGTCSSRCPRKSWPPGCATLVERRAALPMLTSISRPSGLLTSMWTTGRSASSWQDPRKSLPIW